MTFPNVADAILANGMFSHYDRPRIAQLCEKAGLFIRALQVLCFYSYDWLLFLVRIISWTFLCVAYAALFRIAWHQTCHCEYTCHRTTGLNQVLKWLDLSKFFYLFLSWNDFQALVEFFGTLSKEWALECMKDLLLVNLRGNLQIIVQVLY